MKSKKKSNIPAEFADMFYLREIDLMPERLGENKSVRLNLEKCRELYRQGWLFHNREDALRSRETMRCAYVDTVMRIKGSDNILFDRPLCP